MFTVMFFILREIDRGELTSGSVVVMGLKIGLNLLGQEM